MVLILSFAALLFLACAEPDFSNPYDENGKHFIGRGDSSSSSNQSTTEQSSSSIESSSSTTTASSSSSIASSSSTTAPSSSSVASSSSGDGTIVRGEFTDDRDGTVYKWVEIGDQTWMAENLNYDTTGAKCYGEGGTVGITIPPANEFESSRIEYVTLSEEEIQANCAIYGRLYNWATTMGFDESCNNTNCASQNTPHKGICPSGWHIPNSVDWGTLAKYVGGYGDYFLYGAGKVLKATDGWNDFNGRSGNGTDDYGFAALPGGQGGFLSIGSVGFWWSTSEINASSAYPRYMSYNDDGIVMDMHNKSSLYSVRCVKD